jgi:hypothetical protein
MSVFPETRIFLMASIPWPCYWPLPPVVGELETAPPTSVPIVDLHVTVILDPENQCGPTIALLRVISIIAPHLLAEFIS